MQRVRHLQDRAPWTARTRRSLTTSSSDGFYWGARCRPPAGVKWDTLKRPVPRSLPGKLRETEHG